MKETIIGIDIGGTKISGGILMDNNNIGFVRTESTLAHEPKEILLNQISNIIASLINDSEKQTMEIKNIGICAPGPLNPLTGEFLNPPNLPNIWNTNLKEEMQQRFPGYSIIVENDANAAGLAEVKFGAARACKNILYITVSTGIGMGIIINRKIYHGKNGIAGEAGHLSTNYKGIPRCSCGAPECIEGLASGTAIAKRAKDDIKNSRIENSSLNNYKNNLDKLDAKIIAEHAFNGDTQSQCYIKESASLIGSMLGGMINILDPEMIVIGGGMAQIGDLFFYQIRKSAMGFTYNVYAKDIPIVPAELLNNVGIYGAISLFV